MVLSRAWRWKLWEALQAPPPLGIMVPGFPLEHFLLPEDTPTAPLVPVDTMGDFEGGGVELDVTAPHLFPTM